MTRLWLHGKIIELNIIKINLPRIKVSDCEKSYRGLWVSYRYFYFYVNIVRYDTRSF